MSAFKRDSREERQSERKSPMEVVQTGNIINPHPDDEDPWCPHCGGVLFRVEDKIRCGSCGFTDFIGPPPKCPECEADLVFHGDSAECPSCGLGV